MAASVWKRCMTAAVKVKCVSPSFSARRWLLSAAYTDTKMWEARETEPQNLAVLADTMEKTYNRNLPVSSLAMSRFVDSISSREEVDQAEYYLYRFRHSPNCWYLRDWTIHSWIRQCLKYGARDKALYTLKNKVQYGIFPDYFSFNLLIDSYIKDGDFKGACSVVEEVMLQESFDLPSTQILSLYAFSSYLASKPQLTVSEERALGASLLICGLKQDNGVGLSAQLLGNALLGKVEVLKGIHAVFKGMPLFWGRGYLDRALAVMESAASGDVRLSQDMRSEEQRIGALARLCQLELTQDLLQDLSATLDTSSSEEESSDEDGEKKQQGADKDDQGEQAKLQEYASRFQKLQSQLDSQGRVDSTSFQGSVTALAQEHLPSAEKSDLEWYESRVQTWEDEKKQLIQREKELRKKAEQEKAQRLATRAAAEQA